MSNETVQVTAEWALWGKEPHDVEYRLLRCSNGPFSASNFEELITRYSPGTLDSLPQVAIAWGASDQEKYLAITIHRAAGPGLHDASGRKVVLTYCFCVPFRELAAGPVSYQAMYDVFRREQLSAAGNGGIKVDLPVMNVPDPGRRMPMLAASLLLTNVPVCILGADRVDLETRLAFLDSVMALLPYGMRAEMSTSTWTNSIYEEHKFRLFLTSARRHADEHVLRWDPDFVVPVRHDSGDYLHWLSTSTSTKMDLLARQSRPSGFRAGRRSGQMKQDLQAAWASSEPVRGGTIPTCPLTRPTSRGPPGDHPCPDSAAARPVGPDVAPAVVGRRDSVRVRRAPEGEGGKRRARNAGRAGGAAGTAVAARPQAKGRPKAELMVTRGSSRRPQPQGLPHRHLAPGCQVGAGQTRDSHHRRRSPGPHLGDGGMSAERSRCP